MEKLTDKATEVAFHYIKSHQFRVVHSDGFIGGITPRGLLHIAVYSERQAIPTRVVHTLQETDQPSHQRLGEILYQEGREGVARELEVDLMLDEAMAKALHEWLGARLAEFEAIRTGKAK